MPLVCNAVVFFISLLLRQFWGIFVGFFFLLGVQILLSRYGFPTIMHLHLFLFRVVMSAMISAQKRCSNLVQFHLLCNELVFTLFIFIYAYTGCPLRFPYQMMFVLFNSNTMGVISGAGTTYPSGSSVITFCFSEGSRCSIVRFRIVVSDYTFDIFKLFIVFPLTTFITREEIDIKIITVSFIIIYNKTSQKHLSCELIMVIFQPFNFQRTR